MRVTKKWWFLMVALPIVGLCAKAGFWQLDRAAEKQALIERLTVGEAVLRSGSALATADLSNRSYRIEIEVAREDGPLLFLDNRIQDGRAGYEVFSVVRPLNGGQHLLVNLGWVEASPLRSDLPNVEVPDTWMLRGRWVPLTESYTMSAPATEQVDDQIRVQSLLDHQPADALPGLFLALLDHQPADALPGLFLAEGVLSRDAIGPMPRLGPETHYGYAVQWFLMASVLLGLTGWVAVKEFRA